MTAAVFCVAKERVWPYWEMLDGGDKKKGSKKEPYFSGDFPWGWSYLEQAHSAPCTSSCSISENAFPLWFYKFFLCWFAPKCCAFPGHKLLKQLCSAKGKIGRPTWAFQSEDQTPCLSSSSSEQAWPRHPRQEVMQLPEGPPVSLVWQGNRGSKEATSSLTSAVPQAFSLTRTGNGKHHKDQLKPFLGLHSQARGSVSICGKRLRASITHSIGSGRGTMFLWVEWGRDSLVLGICQRVWYGCLSKGRLMSKKLDSHFLRGCWKTDRLKTKVYLSFHLSKFLQFLVWSSRQSKYLVRKVNLKAWGLA